MKRSALVILLAASACSSPNPAPETNQASPNENAASPLVNDVARTSPSGDGPSKTDGATIANQTVTSSTSASTDALSVGDLPLKTGVYASIGKAGEAPSCPPPLASVATFDGEGFGGRSSTGCTFDPTTRTGATWSGPQSCTDTYSKKQRTKTLTITVKSASRFVRTDKFGDTTFALCPEEKLSEWVG